MADDTLATFTGLIRQPHGIVLVTGRPAAAFRRCTPRWASSTAAPATSSPWKTRWSTTSPASARSGQCAHRHELWHRAARDPAPGSDTIMIGEIRDLETTQIAVQSSLTGHGVLASLHTNDAISAVTRLADMGVEPFLLASSLRGVQRTAAGAAAVHAVPACRVDGEGRTVWRAVGCAACANSGYRGRTGIHELFVVDDRVRALIHEGQGEPRAARGRAARRHAHVAAGRPALGRQQGDHAGRNPARHRRRLRRRWHCSIIERQRAGRAKRPAGRRPSARLMLRGRGLTPVQVSAAQCRQWLGCSPVVSQ